MTALPETSIKENSAPARWRADSVLAFVALIWGTTFVVVKAALGEISAVYFLSLRFWIASFCMALLFIRPFRMVGRRAVFAGLKGGAVAGIFLWFGHSSKHLG